VIEDPLVSVLLPVRDAGCALVQALRSLTRQTLHAIEIVAVDDGSADGSGQVLDDWARADERVRVIHTPPGGLVAALNTGLEACRAPYVARMDADDVSHPRRLELQLALLETRHELAAASCLVRHFPSSRVAQGARLYEGWLNGLVRQEEIHRERFVESPVAHPSVMVRREVLLSVGAYRDRGWAEDYDLWLRLMEAGAAFAKVDRHLLFWREHSARLTRVDPHYSKDSFLRCKAHFLLRGPVARSTRVAVWGAGPTGRRLARYLVEGDAPLAAFVDIDPSKIGRTVRGVPVVAAQDLPSLLSPSTVVLAAVASRGARELIRSRLEAMGLEEGSDFWCVA